MTASGQIHPGAEAGTDSGHPLAKLIADRLTGSLGIVNCGEWYGHEARGPRSTTTPRLRQETTHLTT
jgi:hypothetical protein